jgi:TatD DNase family protein
MIVDGRNEPVSIVQVAEVVAELKGCSIEEVTLAAYENTIKMFNL